MRNFEDWISAYVKYADVTEAPPHMHLWAGLSTISGALERKVWVDMKKYKWYPNLYTIFVGPPEEIKKSSTVGPAIQILKKVPGIRFGPKTITWEGLIKFFETNQKEVKLHNGSVELHSPLYVYASELGVFFDPSNVAFCQQMIDMYDGEEIDKATKSSGNEYVENPILNLISCTTPEWIKNNMLPSMVGDGLFSRIIFLYADKGVRSIAWVDEMVDDEDHDTRMKLIGDLEFISEITGPAFLTNEARDIGRVWYDSIRERVREGGSKILQRRQTQVVKVSMCLAASCESLTDSGRLKITGDIFNRAVSILEDTDNQREKVINILLKAKSPFHIDNILDNMKPGEYIKLQDLYKKMMNTVPRWDDFKSMIVSAREAGILEINSRETKNGKEIWVKRYD